MLCVFVIIATKHMGAVDNQTNKTRLSRKLDKVLTRDFSKVQNDKSREHKQRRATTSYSRTHILVQAMTAQVLYASPVKDDTQYKNEVPSEL
jgi:hypothetical protein